MVINNPNKKKKQKIICGPSSTFASFKAHIYFVEKRRYMYRQREDFHIVMPNRENIHTQKYPLSQYLNVKRVSCPWYFKKTVCMFLTFYQTEDNVFQWIYMWRCTNFRKVHLQNPHGQSSSLRWSLLYKLRVKNRESSPKLRLLIKFALNPSWIK